MQKRLIEYCRNLSEDEKIKKRNYAKTKNINMSDVNRERKKEYIKNYYYNRKDLLCQLVNCIEELENVWIKNIDF